MEGFAKKIAEYPEEVQAEGAWAEEQFQELARYGRRLRDRELGSRA